MELLRLLGSLACLKNKIQEILDIIDLPFLNELLTILAGQVTVIMTAVHTSRQSIGCYFSPTYSLTPAHNANLYKNTARAWTAITQGRNCQPFATPFATTLFSDATGLAPFGASPDVIDPFSATFGSSLPFTAGTDSLVNSAGTSTEF